LSDYTSTADQRKELEHLCRYIIRPAITNERLKRNRADQVVLQLRSAFKDGTTHIVMAPLEFMQRLAAAMVPRPHLHLIRFLAYSRPTRSCAVKSFPVHQSLQPSTQPSRTQQVQTAALGVAEKCPTTDQRASHGKFTNHGA
jgi:hypothetical protein